MKRYAVRKCCFIFLFLAVPAFASIAETVDVFIMAGQSNMQGWMGDAALYPYSDPQNLDAQIRFYWVTPGFSTSLGKWTFMHAQSGRFPSGHFGPEVTFARALEAKGYHTAIFKYSLGATGLEADWRRPGMGGLYDKMVVEYKSAVALLQQERLTVRPRAFIWIQGENDAENKYLAEQYYSRLCDLIADVRANVTGVHQLPVILGVDEQIPLDYIDTVVNAQKKFAASDSFAVWTSMMGLEKADFTHLSPYGLGAHGVRLADAFFLIEERGAIAVKTIQWGKIKKQFGKAAAPPVGKKNTPR
jgi:hypothetical protein